MTNSSETLQRVRNDELGGALLKVAAVDPVASQVLSSLFRVLADEAARTPRFAKALSAALVVTSETPDSAAVPAPPKPARRLPSKAKVARQPGVFDPFDVLRHSGEQALTEKLSTLTIDQLRDIIAEQEIDTHKESGRKRKAEVLVAWTFDRVKALASKGSAFR
ncbi:hypothetical protein O1W68_20290 [Rhodococcus sp. H36-A4]|uniref:hypothetical protein n=1 Tax=unclassified Rhodococcus (in: high G+C Gram-positive bacteria) TaxID=192944 RepID=UPI000A0E59C1|nr:MULTISPECIES: hypothetical protein [unclassified Rhodococcus (in: high G+C Gram-positive bacteria)]MCZ4080291.1 hypothetical protein [Rhodococcus sp. H36-A4]ORI21124.1 hypothetical protein BJI47_16890 [Rhodococcus sp. 1168]